MNKVSKVKETIFSKSTHFMQFTMTNNLTKCSFPSLSSSVTWKWQWMLSHYKLLTKLLSHKKIELTFSLSRKQFPFIVQKDPCLAKFAKEWLDMPSWTIYNPFHLNLSISIFQRKTININMLHIWKILTPRIAKSKNFY